MAITSKDSFKTRTSLQAGGKTYEIFSLELLAKQFPAVARLPFSMKVLLEALLRNEDGVSVSKEDIEAVANWKADAISEREIAFYVARVLLQDFTGVPVVVDLAAMREAWQKMGGDPARINPHRPADLVVDHSVQVDKFGTSAAFGINARLENQRNSERYALLKWAQTAFNKFTVVPPDTGIVHQVNIEYLAKVVFSETVDGKLQAFPDTVVGTDSHTTMVNGLGVVGWGVGGIEAEACMLGEPIPMLIPPVVGFRLTGRLPEGATATDLVLTCTQMLRKHKGGVVGKFVEYFGPGIAALTLPDRATIANMSPEYGATIGFFPIDEETVTYLKLSAREAHQVELVEAYARTQGLWRKDAMTDPVYSETLELDLGTVVPSLAGPKRPQDRIPLKTSKAAFKKDVAEMVPADKDKSGGGVVVDAPGGGVDFRLKHGAVVIAAITSCTNTSNPAVMLGAGLLAKKAIEKGLRPKPWVKTSLAPGSKVVTDYLVESGLMPYLEGVGFHLVGYGCTTCIGNSGPLPEPIVNAIKTGDLAVSAVLSGNRNFEGRIHPNVRMNYLASPPLVVAYALAGTMDIDLETEPLGTSLDGDKVFLKDIWPSAEEIRTAVGKSIHAGQFKKQYAAVLEGDANWKATKVPTGNLFQWDSKSTYVRLPPYFENMPATPAPVSDVKAARVLALFGDSITTDHISPAGDISAKSPAGAFLESKGVGKSDFNSYGARRGNHEVMMRGTFANIRLKNAMLKGAEGGDTLYQPGAEKMSIYDASMKYQAAKVPLVILAGAEYGSGSSRDWAAKGALLLGVKVVVAVSFERIHRSNLVGMGVLPLQFVDKATWQSLGIDGTETFDVEDLASLQPGKKITVKVHGKKEFSFPALCRIDTPKELEYYKNGGILQYVLRKMNKG
jgi:aconitate hydratase